MKTKHILMLFAGLLLMSLSAGCRREPATDTPLQREQFRRKSLAGIYQENKALYSMDLTNDQLYYNPTTKTSRIVNNEGDAYIQFVLSEPVGTLSVDDPVTVSVTSKGKGDLPTYDNLSMVVLKKENNFCWIWNGKRQLGFLIYYVK